jgi:hydrophobe/amphiphile efflux-3 (HAE3) family protein
MKESFVHRLVGFAIHRSWIVILITALLTMFLGYFALQIRIDADIFNMLPRHHEVLELAEKYGSSNQDTGQLLLAVENEEVFDIQKLQLFEAAIREIESLDSIIGSINPYNFITFVQEGTKLTPVSTAPEARAPRTQAELQEFKSRLLENPLARNMVLSSDGKALCAVFPVKFQEDYTELLDTVERARSMLEPYFAVYTTGSPIFLQKTKLSLLEDVPKFLVLGVAVILAILFLSFRSLRALALPLIVVSLGTLWTMGTMRLLGFPLTVVSIMVPPLVLTLGSAYSIHILNQYYREARVKPGDKSWIAQSVGHINQTILMAALTTIIGFSSLVSANLVQIREFGLSTSIGIAYCAALSLFFFPAVLSLLPPPRVVERDRVLKGPIARFMEGLSGWVIRHRYLILATIVLIAVAFGFALKHVSYQTDYLSYYRKKERIVRDSRVLVRRFGGYTNIYLTIEAPEERNNYFLDPQVLKKISAFENKLSADPDICYIFSFNQYLKLMNLRASGSFTVPERRAPILLLSRYMKSIVSSPYGQSVDARPINEHFSTLTITLRAWDGTDESLLMEPELKALIARIKGLIESELDIEARTVIWGRALALLYISETLSRDQILSVLVSLVLIFLVTALGFRSIPLGLLTLIPMTTGIMLNFIIMVVLKLPFDVVTVMFSSVAIGVGIDDSIHLIIRYRRQTRIYQGDVHRSAVLAHTLKTAGRPILLTSMSLVAGLLVLCFSQFLPILYFGMLVSLALATTTAGALIILPAILSLGSGSAAGPGIKSRPKIESGL